MNLYNTGSEGSSAEENRQETQLLNIGNAERTDKSLWFSFYNNIEIP